MGFLDTEDTELFFATEGTEALEVEGLFWRGAAPRGLVAGLSGVVYERGPETGLREVLATGGF